MKLSKGLIFFALAALSVAQSRREPERPLKQPVRGVHGAVAAGSEWATEAGMRTYYKGGNAVDVGVATMFAGSVSELSHYGFGGEASILIRTKDGKVHSIAGVGTMPKLATADLFRNRPLQPFEVTERDPGGLKGIIPASRADAGAGAGHGGRRAGGAARIRQHELRASDRTGHRSGRRFRAG